MNPRNHESMHTDDLLIDEALGWLDPEDAADLARRRAAGQIQNDTADALIAQVLLTAADPAETLPADLRERLVRDAQAHVSRTRAHADVRAERIVAPAGMSCRPSVLRRLMPLGLTGVAAAAAVALWLGASGRLGIDPGAAPDPTPAQFALIAERTTFANTARDVRRTHLRSERIRANTDETDIVVVGEIIWSEGQRRGYCTLRHMVANQPESERYELFLQDATTGMISSAGAFDIPDAPCDTIVPFEVPNEIRAAGTFYIVRVPRDTPGTFIAEAVVAQADVRRV